MGALATSLAPSMLGVVQQGGGASGALFELCVGRSGVRTEAVNHVCSIKRNSAAALACVTTDGAFNTSYTQCISATRWTVRAPAAKRGPQTRAASRATCPVAVRLRPGRVPCL